jgi:uncharacterized protein (DUF2164 family)
MYDRYMKSNTEIMSSEFEARIFHSFLTNKNIYKYIYMIVAVLEK